MAFILTELLKALLGGLLPKPSPPDVDEPDITKFPWPGPIDPLPGPSPSPYPLPGPVLRPLPPRPGDDLVIRGPLAAGVPGE